MDERVKISLLLDLYERLLTAKQKDIMDLYFNDDLSLAEISEITNTSRQAVFDTIKRCEKTLLDYEDKLMLLARNEKLEQVKNLILRQLKNIDENTEANKLLAFKKELEEYILQLI